MMLRPVRKHYKSTRWKTTALITLPSLWRGSLLRYQRLNARDVSYYHQPSICPLGPARAPWPRLCRCLSAAQVAQVSRGSFILGACMTRRKAPPQKWARLTFPSIPSRGRALRLQWQLCMPRRTMHKATAARRCFRRICTRQSWHHRRRARREAVFSGSRRSQLARAAALSCLRSLCERSTVVAAA